MSAFTLSNKHINAMLSAAKWVHFGFGYYWNNERHTGCDMRELGQKLMDENYRSVNYRYSDETEAPRFKWNAYPQQHTAVQVIRLCDCYNYQTCETPDWQETEAYAIYTALREAAIGALPGMDDAEWTI